MSIEMALEETRPQLNDIDMSQVRPINISDPMDLVGRIAERLVFEWLQKVEFDFLTGFPFQTGMVRWEDVRTGVRVIEGNNYKHEFDFVGTYEGTGYVVEVKSLKLNGISKKIDKALKYGQMLYGDDVRMILFSPHYSNKHRDIETIRVDYPQVLCVDSGYKRKQLRKACDRFYRKG